MTLCHCCRLYCFSVELTWPPLSLLHRPLLPRQPTRLSSQRTEDTGWSQCLLPHIPAYSCLVSFPAQDSSTLLEALVYHFWSPLLNTFRQKQVFAFIPLHLNIFAGLNFRRSKRNIFFFFLDDIKKKELFWETNVLLLKTQFVERQSWVPTRGQHQLCAGTVAYALYLNGAA